MQCKLHIHLYLVYKKIKHFTTQTCEVIKIRKTAGTSIQDFLHYILTLPMHFIVQPLLQIKMGHITRELPCNIRLELFNVSLSYISTSQLGSTTLHDSTTVCYANLRQLGTVQRSAVLHLATRGQETHCRPVTLQKCIS